MLSGPRRKKTECKLMIKLYRTCGLAHAPAPSCISVLICLWLCLVQVVDIHGKHEEPPVEFKSKDSAHYGSKKQSMNLPMGQQQQLQTLSPEMLLLSGSQKNDLNLVPVKVDAPKELYMTGPEEKPIVISLSNDKQVLSEESRMLPKPILVEGNLTNSEFFRNFWMKLNKERNASNSGIDSAHTINGLQRSATASPSINPGKEKEEIVSKKYFGFEPMKRNEMLATLAAINPSKDCETANEASSSDPKDSFNQSLSSDQLLCVIYKLLSLYKPDFNSCPSDGPCSATRSRAPRVSPKSGTVAPSTLRPIDNVLYNLAVSKGVGNGPLKYRSPWNYLTSPPKEFGNDPPFQRGMSDDHMSAQKVANILDSLPLIRSFNEYSHLPSLLAMDKDTSAESSCSGLRENRKYGGAEAKKRCGSIDGPKDAFKAAMLRDYAPVAERDNVSVVDNHRSSGNHDVRSRNEAALKEMLMIASNMTAKQLPKSAFRSDLPEETYDFYFKLLRKLQEKDGERLPSIAYRTRSFAEPDSQSLTKYRRFERPTYHNRSIETEYLPLMDFSTKLIAKHINNLKQHNMQDSHELSLSIPDKMEVNVVNKPVSGYNNKNSKSKKDPFSTSGLDFSCHSTKHAKGSFNSKDNYWESSDLNNRILVDSKPSCLQLKHIAEIAQTTARKKEKLAPETQRRKKLQLKFKRRSKEERKKKSHESFDFLDLLSKSMLQESKNFEGRI